MIKTHLNQQKKTNLSSYTLLLNNLLVKMNNKKRINSIVFIYQSKIDENYLLSYSFSYRSMQINLFSSVH
jgi:hypothetical protein